MRVAVWVIWVAAVAVTACFIAFPSWDAAPGQILMWGCVAYMTVSYRTMMRRR